MKGWTWLGHLATTYPPLIHYLSTLAKFLRMFHHRFHHRFLHRFLHRAARCESAWRRRRPWCCFWMMRWPRSWRFDGKVGTPAAVLSSYAAPEAALFNVHSNGVVFFTWIFCMSDIMFVAFGKQWLHHLHPPHMNHQIILSYFRWNGLFAQRNPCHPCFGCFAGLFATSCFYMQRICPFPSFVASPVSIPWKSHNQIWSNHHFW